jgi:hypothetical protein
LISFQAQWISFLDDRLKELDDRRWPSLDSKREEFCKREITGFMTKVSGQGIASCTPDDIRRFLVWEDQVYRIECQFLRNKGISSVSGLEYSECEVCRADRGEVSRMRAVR